MSDHPIHKTKLFKGQKVHTKRYGGEAEGTIVDFYEGGKVLVEVAVKERFVANEATIFPKNDESKTT